MRPLLAENPRQLLIGAGRAVGSLLGSRTARLTGAASSPQGRIELAKLPRLHYYVPITDPPFAS